MKNYIKNNPFLSFVIIVMWIFFLCLSISEKGFFTEHITEPIGTTIFFIGIGTVITMNKEKIKNKEEKGQDTLEKIDESEQNNIKKNKSNKVKKFFKIYIIILLSTAVIVTSIIFYIRKLEFSFHKFFIMIVGCCFIEVAIAGIFGMIVKVVAEYSKDCKKNGVLKATIWLIVMIMMVALFIYNKDAKWFRK